MDQKKDKKREPDREEVTQILERAAYLEQEARMLTRVIDQVPYDEQFSDQLSMQQRLERIDLIQTDYIKPLIKKVQQSEDVITYPDIESFFKNLENDNPKFSNIQVLLEHLASHRQEVVSALENLESKIWSGQIRINEKNHSLGKVLLDVIEFEREQLSNIADQVMMVAQQRKTEREIEEKRKKRGGSDEIN